MMTEALFLANFPLWGLGGSVSGLPTIMLGVVGNFQNSKALGWQDRDWPGSHLCLAHLCHSSEELLG